MSRIFISYRQDDAPGEAGRLHDTLAGAFGAQQVFMDIVDLQPGDDFVDAIKSAVGSCDVLVAVIGKRWLNSEHASGGKRLDDPEDFVRLEIEAALQRNVRVVPALVSDAVMPRSSELPESMTALARRQAVQLSHLRWAHDVGRLVEAIKRAIETGPAQAEPIPAPSSDATSLDDDKRWSLGDQTFSGDWEEVERRSETYRWPDGKINTLEPLIVYRGTADYAGFSLGIGHDSTGGVAGFVLDQRGRLWRGVTAFFPADDYAETREVVSMIRGGGPRGRSGFQPGEALPKGYVGINVGVLGDRVGGKWNVQAVVAKPDDFRTILAHTALQARLRGLA